MNNEKLVEIMKKFHIYDYREAEEAIEFVRELLETDADLTEVNEPYATNSIRRIRESARDVGDLLSLVYDADEKYLK
jgi:hypothetical protein